MSFVLIFLLTDVAGTFAARLASLDSLRPSMAVVFAGEGWRALLPGLHENRPLMSALAFIVSRRLRSEG